MIRFLIIPAVLAAFTLARPTLSAAAPPCPAGMVWACSQKPAPPYLPLCACVYKKSHGTSPPDAPGGPKQKKKNVPTVKPNKTPGSND